MKHTHTHAHTRVCVCIQHTANTRQIKDPFYSQKREQRPKGQSQKPQQMALLSQSRPIKAALEALCYPWRTETSKQARGLEFSNCSGCKAMKSMSVGMRGFSFAATFILCIVISSQGFSTQLSVILMLQRSTDEA